MRDKIGNFHLSLTLVDQIKQKVGPDAVAVCGWRKVYRNHLKNVIVSDCY